MEEDILQEISNDKVEEILNFLQKSVPITLNVLNLLKSVYKEDPSQETELKVFCPKGEISSGVVIVSLVYLNKCGYNFVKMYCSEDKVSLLQQALIKTRRLNWSSLIFEGLHHKLWPTVKAVLQIKNIPHRTTEYRSMFLPCELYNEVIVPEEFIIRPLTNEDATLVDETWAYHNPTTYDYIHHSIVFYGGLGLVHKHNSQLVSWAVGVWNTIGMVHTMPEYRKQGYAEVAIKALARKLISISVQPVCLIKQDNSPSLRLFKKLGFVDAGMFYCIDLE